jgi:hypothetical protein
MPGASRYRGLAIHFRMLHNPFARLSVGRFNTEEEIDRAIEQVAAAMTALREANPLYALAAGKLPRGNVSRSASGDGCCCGPEGCSGGG